MRRKSVCSSGELVRYRRTANDSRVRVDKFVAFWNSVAVRKSGLGRVRTLPSATPFTGISAQVALQRCPILCTGGSEYRRAYWFVQRDFLRQLVNPDGSRQLSGSGATVPAELWMMIECLLQNVLPPRQLSHLFDHNPPHSVQLTRVPAT